MMTPAVAQAPADPVREFNIEAQSLDTALKSYAIATNKQLLFSTDLVEGKTTRPVEGEMSDSAALQKLLAGSGLAFEKRDTNVILVRTAAQQQAVANQGGGAGIVEEIERGDPSIDEDTAGADAKKRDEITVTGTLIKGIAPETSPLQVFSRQDVMESGASSLEDFLKRGIPQNFGGGSSEFAPGGLPNDRNSQANNTLGTGANLRGLGSRGTLVLLNGNRMAPTSSIGDFVDLSLIPISALERIDVLSDGASSLYGGDAVAGVINFVLRDDFEGAETSVRYGTVTSGDMDEYRLSQTLGAAWDTGNILATYEYFDRDNLTLSDRLEIAPPTLSNGTPISTTDAFDLLPKQEKHSAVLSVIQSVGPALTLSASGLYANRSTQSTTSSAGVSSNISESDSNSESISATFSADYDLSSRWSAKLNTNFSQVRNREAFSVFVTPDPVPNIYRSKSDLWSIDLSANGDVFKLPGGFVKAAIGGHYRQENFAHQRVGGDPSSDGDRDVMAVYGETMIPLIGEGNALPWANRVEIVASARLDDYSDFGTTVNPKVGALWSPVEGLNIRGSYSTSFAPPALGRAAALDRTGAIFPYSFILGIFGAEAPDPSLEGVNYLVTTGTMADLKPETSRTFTGGLDWNAEFGDDTLSASASYYDISFKDRLGSTPIPNNLNSNLAPGLAYNDPSLFPDGTVIFFPSQQLVDSIIATFIQPPSALFGATLDNIQIINNANAVRNLASTSTRGVEGRIDYVHEADVGRLKLGVNANYIIDFKERAAETTPEVQSLNTLYNPVALRIRGNMGFSRGGFSASAFVNYTDSYKTDNSPSAEKIDAWTTVDFLASYKIESQSAWLNGTSISLSVSNLFDKTPPSTPTYGTFILAGYDPANASPLKRFIAFELSKRF